MIAGHRALYYIVSEFPPRDRTAPRPTFPQNQQPLPAASRIPQGLQVPANDQFGNISPWNQFRTSLPARSALKYRLQLRRYEAKLL